MKNTEQNHLDAAQVVSEYLQQPANVAIWTPLEAFGEGVTAIGGSLNILHALAQIQGGKTEGVTTNKERLRQSVTTRLINAAKACLAFGNATDNDDLVAQANALNSRTEVDAIRDGALADRAQAFYDRALAARTGDAATAAKYGLKTGAADKLLAPLLSAITAYGAAVPSPQSAINRRANATAGIAAELSRLQSQLKDLDNLIPQFEEEHPDFVAGYHQARQIIDRNGGGESNTGTPPTPGPNP